MNIRERIQKVDQLIADVELQLGRLSGSLPSLRSFINMCLIVFIILLMTGSHVVYQTVYVDSVPVVDLGVCAPVIRYIEQTVYVDKPAREQLFVFDDSMYSRIQR